MYFYLRKQSNEFALNGRGFPVKCQYYFVVSILCSVQNHQAVTKRMNKKIQEIKFAQFWFSDTINEYSTVQN